jgi:hypothetical protein
MATPLMICPKKNRQGMIQGGNMIGNPYGNPPYWMIDDDR